MVNRYIPTFVLPLAAVLALGACTVFPGPNLQGGAGVTDVSISTPDGVTVDWFDAKEKDRVRITAKLPDGTEFTYLAEDVRAFRAHEVRAEVEKAQIETQGEAIPALTEAIVNALVDTGLVIP